MPAAEPIPIAAPDPESTGAARSLRAALAHRGLRLRFEPAMEHAYERDTGGVRSKRAFVSSMLGTFVFAVLSAIDMHKLSHAADLLWGLHIGVLSFCAIGLLWQWPRLHRLTPWERDGITAMGSLLMGAYITVEAHLARDVLGVMIGGNLIFVFLFAGLIARLEFPFTVVVCLLTLATYAGGATAYNALTHAILVNHFTLCVSVAAISLAGNYLLERRERRAYLLQRLSMLHRDAVEASAEALRKLTLRDPLTGLANRRHFDTVIEKLWRSAETTALPVGLLQIDVDFFKRYNDRYGHPMGDVSLQRIGAQLDATAAEEGGLAARIGGEEFVVLLPGADLARTGSVADRLCAQIRALAIPHIDSCAAAFMTISVGFGSMHPTATNRPTALMRAADLALYRAKREGRDRAARVEWQDTADTATQAFDPKLPDRAEPGSITASERVRNLRELLASGLHKLRFPPEIEADYMAQNSRQRQNWIVVVVLLGLAVTCGYVWLNLPLHADIAGEFMHGTLVLCGVLGLPWLLTLHCTLPPHWREAMLSMTASVLIVGLLTMESRSRWPGLQSGTLAVSMALIVHALIAAPPMRFVLPSALALSVGIGALTWFGEPEDHERWVSSLSMLLTTCIYALFGSYALDLSNRRGYLLDRLGDAQMSELKSINADLERLALTDTLTQLPNRRHFESRISAFWQACRSTDAPLAMLIIDIDHFKLYNDNHGHLAGDACLQRVGAFIAAWCDEQPPHAGQRLGAFAARLGGEEFGVLLPGLDAAAALGVAARLCAALHAQRSPHGHSPVSEFLTASIGTASQRPSNSQDLRQLLRIADEALYRAKATGRNRAAV